MTRDPTPNKTVLPQSQSGPTPDDETDLTRTESSPAFETHLGEVNNGRRFCIIWINGKRWQGYLEETEQ
jgi:hypothetical protein